VLNILEELTATPLLGGCKSYRLSSNKQPAWKFHMERYNLKRLANLENLDDDVDINRAWEIIRI
jgi:hypothetical protein